MFKFNEAVSLQVFCESQDEIDYYWDKLAGRRSEGAAVRLAEGQVRALLAGRAEGMEEMLKDPESPGAQRAMEAMLSMKKIDIAALAAGCGPRGTNAPVT